MSEVDSVHEIEAFRALARSPIVFLGFRWVVVRCDGARFDDDALVGAVNDSLRALARPGATAPEAESVARQLAGMAENLARSGRALRDAASLTRWASALPWPVVALAASTWRFAPPLCANSIVGGCAPKVRAQLRPTVHTAGPPRCCPGVSFSTPATWASGSRRRGGDPPETAVELGLARPSRRSAAGIDDAASTGPESAPGRTSCRTHSRPTSAEAAYRFSSITANGSFPRQSGLVRCWVRYSVGCRLCFG